MLNQTICMNCQILNWFNMASFLVRGQGQHVALSSSEANSSVTESEQVLGESPVWPLDTASARPSKMWAGPSTGSSYCQGPTQRAEQIKVSGESGDPKEPRARGACWSEAGLQVQGWGLQQEAWAWGLWAEARGDRAAAKWPHR